MHGNSRRVSSRQQGCHEQLETLVRKHLAQPSRRPAAGHTRDAFAAIRERVESVGRPLVFDSFCGTGMSAAALARQHPDSLVIGIDKSSYRLAKHAATEAHNYLLVQAECGDFWRLAAAAGWQPSRHYLLYPNPWPKPGQVKRRVHGGADFRELIALGGDIELRSNWQVYVEEFAQALRIAGFEPQVESLAPAEPLTLFERKYMRSDHQLWRCTCRVGHNRQSDIADNS